MPRHLIPSILLAPLILTLAVCAPPEDEDDWTPDNGSDGQADNSQKDEDQCNKHTKCDFDEICYERTCEYALDRQYRVTIKSIQVSTEYPYEGGAWDGFGGAPDLYVVFGYADDACVTDTGNDSFQETYNDACDFILNGEPFHFEVWDDDVNSDDRAISWTLEGTDDHVDLARLFGGHPRIKHPKNKPHHPN